jgi:hypothetical protein
MSQTPNFTSDYLYRYSNDECHSDFHFWASLTLIGAVLGPRVYINHGRFKAIPVLFTVLVGTAGSGKSSAKDVVRDLMTDFFPDYMLSASFQSPGDFLEQLGMPEALRCFEERAKPGSIKEYRPAFLLINELASFLSIDHQRMIATLIDIFDAKAVSTGFKKSRREGMNQTMQNPHIPMIACVQPKWFMSNMKMDLFETGLGRRMCIVFRDKGKLNHDPQFPEDSQPHWNRVLLHLKRLYDDKTQGECKLTAESQEWWKDYYYDKERRKKSEDPLISEFQETEHMVLLRVALILSFCEYEFKYLITSQHLQLARILLDNLKPDIIRLTGGIGSNPMAGVIQQMLDFVRINNGMVREIRVKQSFWKICPRGTMDYDMGLKQLVETKMLVMADIGTDMPVRWCFTPEGWEKYNNPKK